MMARTESSRKLIQLIKQQQQEWTAFQLGIILVTGSTSVVALALDHHCSGRQRSQVKVQEAQLSQHVERRSAAHTLLVDGHGRGAATTLKEHEKCYSWVGWITATMYNPVYRILTTLPNHGARYTQCASRSVVASMEQQPQQKKNGIISQQQWRDHNDDDDDDDDDSLTSSTTVVVTDPSWIQRTLHWCGVYRLPLPRIIRPGDPALQLPAALLKQRQRDEKQLQCLQYEMEKVIHDMQQSSIVIHNQRTSADDKNTATSNNSNNNDDGNEQQQQQLKWLDQQRKRLGLLAAQQYEVLYGPGVTPQDRMDFLARYGCTASTPAVLRRLVELGNGRGYIEVGAGHGQWARAIEDELQLQRKKQLQRGVQVMNHQPQDFVLAYDDWSRLPLDPNVYHAKTIPHAAYFGKVHRIHRRSQTQSSSSSPDASLPLADPLALLLSQWKHRGRILLLVFPTPKLAITALKAYAAVAPENDTIVYVGEGRGGANANNDFFDFLAKCNDDDNEWVLIDVLPVRPFGTKGFEKLYIFQKLKKKMRITKTKVAG